MNKQKKSQFLALLNNCSALSNSTSSNNVCNNNQFQPFYLEQKSPNINLVYQSDKGNNASLINCSSNCFKGSEKHEISENIDKTPNFSSENETISELPSNDNSHARRKFTPEEDLQLKKLIEKYGPRKWDKIALSMPGRTGRQCRDRFANYLDPSLVNGPWTKEEDILLEQKVFEVGQHWNVIAKFFRGRSANNIKNRWYTYLSGQKKCKPRIISLKNNHKSNLQYKNKLNEQKNYNGNQYNTINDQIYNNYGNYSDNMNSNNHFASIINNNQQMNTSNDIENDLNINFASKPEIDKKILFPPIYPPEDSFVFPLNNGFVF